MGAKSNDITKELNARVAIRTLLGKLGIGKDTAVADVIDYFSGKFVQLDVGNGVRINYPKGKVDEIKRRQKS